MRLVTLTLLPLALLTGCFTGPPPSYIATPDPDPRGVGGRYCYRSALDNVREHPYRSVSSAVTGFTAVPLGRMPARSLVHVTERDSALIVAWTEGSTRRSHTLPIRRRLPNGSVEVRLRNPSGGVVLGLGVSRRWAAFSRTPDGKLSLVEHYEEKGLGLLVIPFADHLAWAAALDPAASCDQAR